MASSRICSVEGCDKRHYAKSYCHLHWKRWKTHGDPLRNKATERLPVADRFWAMVDRRGADDCWEWTGFRLPSGYGVFRIEPGAGGTAPASRASWTINKGPIPDSLHVLHRCDNPPCVNPAHLFLGTHDDNMKDMAAKGRATPQCGSVHVLAKLTEDQAEAVFSDPRSYREIATDYGIPIARVHGIKSGGNWRHIAPDQPRQRRQKDWTPAETKAEIIRRHLAGETQSALAKEFDLDPSSISRMVTGNRSKSRTRVTG